MEIINMMFRCRRQDGCGSSTHACTHTCLVTARCNFIQELSQRLHLLCSLCSPQIFWRDWVHSSAAFSPWSTTHIEVHNLKPVPQVPYHMTRTWKRPTSYRLSIASFPGLQSRALAVIEGLGTRLGLVCIGEPTFLCRLAAASHWSNIKLLYGCLVLNYCSACTGK